jgi:hypothetical protein
LSRSFGLMIMSVVYSLRTQRTWIASFRLNSTDLGNRLAYRLSIIHICDLIFCKLSCGREFQHFQLAKFNSGLEWPWSAA